MIKSLLRKLLQYMELKCHAVHAQLVLESRGLLIEHLSQHEADWNIYMCARLMGRPMTKAVTLFTGNLGNLRPLARIMQADIVHHLVAPQASFLPPFESSKAVQV